MIAEDGLAEGDVSAAADALAEAGCTPSAPRWLESGIACDVGFRGDAAAARAALEGLIPAGDSVVQPEAHRRKALLVADMDSTMIAAECIDELADYAGVKAEVAAVTERAMAGEMDFAEALAARVALLRGLESGAIARCRAEQVRATPGARTLVRTMRHMGAHTILVSGGFTAFAEPIAAELGFDAFVANRLEEEGGRLTGTVAPPILGAEAKREALTAALSDLGLAPEASMAIGDGANDRLMITAAGLGIAWRAKPALLAVADARIDHNSLAALLYAQGFKRKEWYEV